MIQTDQSPRTYHILMSLFALNLIDDFISIITALAFWAAALCLPLAHFQNMLL